MTPPSIPPRRRTRLANRVSRSPDHRTGEIRSTLRSLGTPLSVRVRTDREGIPIAVHVEDRKPPIRVISVRETWRIDEEWWRIPISRLYHQVVLENGKMLTLYRDLTEENGWYLQ